MRWPSTSSLSVLVAALAGNIAPAQDVGRLSERLGAIVKAQDEAHRRFVEDLRGKTTEEAQKPATDLYLAEMARNTGQVLEMVRANPTDPAVVEALKFVIKTAGRGPECQSYRAMEILLDGHVSDPGMGDLCGRIFHFGHAPVAESLLRAVLARHPTHEDRGLACHSLATLLGYRASMIRSIREGRSRVDDYVHEEFMESTKQMVRESDPTALDHESVALLERCVAEFSDVKDWFTPERSIGAIAEGEIFAIRNLAVGRVAPEITGKDQEGKTFSLSDYRGKVVVLTFSASWCGPCVGMYPQERELARRLAGKPFAMLSVNADEDLGALRKSVASGEITWRCWWDGGMDGPITTRWGVSAIPEIFVLDRAGVIRKKDVRGAELEKVVDELIEEKSSDGVNKR
jgi:thiol-disulfide isomerase/thioredoxin